MGATSRRPYPQPALTDVRIQSSTAGTDGTGCLFPAGTGGGGCSSSTTTSPLPATFDSRTYLRCVNTVPTYGRLRRDEGTMLLISQFIWIATQLRNQLTQMEEYFLNTTTQA